MKVVLAWTRQPTTVAGISALFGATAAHLAGQISWIQSMPIIAGALVSILLPDDSAAKADAEALSAALASKLTAH